ncbi:hypothetical protein VaNZ11_002793 [Volvox africanus]|uniref:STIL N-terminal domain-containing protein n=1 Tax=Volvox africanus TaxID=51714 RepID=A0ABQ5RSZ9_9CHLO|nr:hypothetical protein VaNZ11_002793 [Volvox africanus]
MTMYRSAFFNKTTQHVLGTTPAAPVVSESIVAQAPITLFGNQPSSRSLKFPSSRKFLWDRTPLGRVEVVELKEQLPIVNVPSDFHRRIGPDRTAIANVTCPNGGRLHINLQSASASHQSTHESIVVPLAASAGGPRSDQLAALLQNLQHGLDKRCAGRLTSCFALGLALQASGSGGRAEDMIRSNASTTTLMVTLLLPAVALSLTPLYAKRLCDVQLAHTLSQQGGDDGVQTGYLTMDQARSLLPLAADDSNVYSVPLVGVWVRGVRGTNHPVLYATALQFAYASTLPDRAVQPDGAFLLLIFSNESPVARCYEARFTDPIVQPQPRPQGQDGRSGLFSPAVGSSSNSGAVVDGGGCCGFGGSGLRVLPYLAKAELAAQTAAPLELKPVLDSVMAAAAGAHLTLPPRSGAPGQTPQQPANGSATALDTVTTPRTGMGDLALGVRVHSAAGPGFTSRYDVRGNFQLRGSGSKLMTSPSKAMKILAGDSGVTYSGVEDARSRVGPRITFGEGSRAQAASLVGDVTAAPAGGLVVASGWGGGALSGGAGLGTSLSWTTSRSGFVPAAPPNRDSPPIPRSSAVPTPFRAVPGAPNNSTRAPCNAALATASTRVVSDGSNGDDGVCMSSSAAPRDPRLQHRATGAEAPRELSISAADPRGLGDGRAWKPAPQYPASSVTAAGGVLPSLPAVRVSGAGVSTTLPSPSREGFGSWGDSVSGVMATPAVTLAKRDGPSVGATPQQLHDMNARYAQLQKQLNNASEEVIQQQQQQEPQVTKPAAWTDGAKTRAMPEGWGSDAGQVATLQLATAKQPTDNPDNYVHRQGQQGSTASRGAAANYGSEVLSWTSSDLTWRMQETTPGGGDAVTSRRAEVVANQSFDGCLRAGAQARSSGYGSAIQTSAALGMVADAAGVRHYPAAVPPMEIGITDLRRSGGNDDNYCCDSWQQNAASPSHPECFGSQIAAGLFSTAPLQRPASAGPYHPRARSQPGFPQPQQQQRSTDQRQQSPRREPIAEHGPYGRSSATIGRDHQQGPLAETDCHLVDRHGARNHAFPQSTRPQQPPPHRAALDLQPPQHSYAQQQLQQHPQQQASQHPQQLLQSPHGQQHPDGQAEHRVPAGQAALLDQRVPMALSAVPPEDIDKDDLPMDTVLLKGEVLRLRRQVANLEQQLRSLTCSECQQRLQFTDEHERGVAVMASRPEEACRLAAAAITSTAPVGQRQVKLKAEMQDGCVTDASRADSTSTSSSNRAWQQLQAQPPPFRECPAKCPPSGSHNRASRAAGTDTPRATQPQASLSCGINNIVPDAVAAYGAGTAANPTCNESCVRQPTASAVATTTTALNAGDRTECMSVVSEASDRGSVWSMASLQSSIRSYRSCLSPSTSRISVDGSDGGSGFTGSGLVQTGDPVSLGSNGGEPASERNGAIQISCGGNKCSDRFTVASQGRDSEHLTLTQTSPEMPPLVQEVYCVSNRLNTASGFEVSAFHCAPTAVAAAPSAAGRAVDSERAARESWDGREFVSCQPSPFRAPPSTTCRMNADFLCTKSTTSWERAAGGSRNCGRRRPRQTSSDSGSDSDQSLLASDLDEAVVHARPSTAPSLTTAAPTATNRAELRQAQPASITRYNSNTKSASFSVWSGHPHGLTAPPLSPSPHVSARGLLAAVSIGPVVRTKYIPLDDDSDSGDSESDGLLEQKYGIRRTEL